MTENTKQLRAILDTAVDAIITIDERGVIESANPATERLFGYSCEELIGQNISILMPSPHRERHDGYLRQYVKTGVRKIIGIGREIVGQRKDGTEFPIHLAVSEYWDDGQRKFAGIVRDISDLKRTQLALEELNKQLEYRVQQRTAELEQAQATLVAKEKLATLGQVSGGIAHEIRNPLNVIKTSVYFLLNAPNAPQKKIEEHLQRIDRQVTLIENVVSALTDVARLPAPNCQLTDVGALVRESSRSVSLRSDVEIDIDASVDQCPKIFVDPQQIAIVLRNLIRNARDAMPDGGVVRIAASPTDRGVQIRIADTGVGIPEEIQARIGELMFTTKARGIGLGLAVSKAILDRNRGTLHFESTPGKETVFMVDLPTAPLPQ